ncbi:hypothetical protein PIB30_057686 [Stylosanthes scabra]|uniref:Uncharacterized protein n=1 Tax=Stylosanthes scabra TaxID=79078 RepID=A0ABU6TLV0_9FABA|nr:hypothetical protein [Stylosanthes scabra]
MLYLLSSSSQSPELRLLFRHRHCDRGSMMKDGGRGRGTASKGRERPKKNTVSGLSSTPTTMTITMTTTTPLFVATDRLHAGLFQMIMILTSCSRVQSSDTAGALRNAAVTTHGMMFEKELKRSRMSSCMEHYKWYAPYLAKHLMKQSTSCGRSGGRDSYSLETMRPTCAILGTLGRRY